MSTIVLHGVLCGLLSLIVLCAAEKFTSLKDLESILVAEHGIAHDLRDYIRTEEHRLQRLRELSDDFENHSSEALEDPVRHLGNPINAFLLVKRFTTDWDKIMEDLIVPNTTQSLLDNIHDKAEYFPDNEDLSGAGTALIRLQDTYKLSTGDIALGDLQGVKKSPELTAQDCFELGRITYDSGDHYHSIMWMEEALERESRETEKTASRAVILDYLSFSVYQQGGLRRALNLTIDWLQLEPDTIRAQNNKQYYEQMIAEQEEERRQKGDDGTIPRDAPFENIRQADEYRGSEDFQNYEALCRGEETIPVPNKHKLTCQFKRKHVIHTIAPLREEIVNFDPFIAIYHDLITESEIAKIKELAIPRLHRSGVFILDEQASHYTRYRTSKSAWLEDEDDPIIRRLSLKAAHLSNLTLESVESFQVLNYGIGGHYEPHYDFARPEEITTFTDETGNRIATVIFYMTDVEAGGNTVFPELGIKLSPRKGACALWYNLKRNGDGDYRTKHAGCPVLTGTKWICNKWFHERGQEFIRPCTLDQNI